MSRLYIRSTPYSILSTGADGSVALQAANHASLSPANVCLEIWFRPTGPRKACVLFDNSLAGVTNSYFLFCDAAGQLNWFSTIGGIARNLTNMNSRRVRWDEWNLTHASYNGSALNFFLNGGQLTEQTTGISGALGTNSGVLRIGSYFSGGSGIGIKGGIYKPRIYNVGCTLAEHQNRYYNNITSAALQAGLVLDPDMTLGSGTITDLSGNGNTLTIGANSAWSSIDTPFKARGATAVRTISATRSLSATRALA